MATKKAFIYIDSDGEARVYPPVIVLEKLSGNTWDDFDIINQTDDNYVFAIEDGVLEDGNGSDVDVKPVKKNGGKSGVLKRKKSGMFPYTLFGLKSGKKAKGNSDPVIIIEI